MRDRVVRIMLIAALSGLVLTGDESAAQTDDRRGDGTTRPVLRVGILEVEADESHVAKFGEATDVSITLDRFSYLRTAFPSDYPDVEFVSLRLAKWPNYGFQDVVRRLLEFRAQRCKVVAFAGPSPYAYEHLLQQAGIIAVDGARTSEPTAHSGRIFCPGMSSSVVGENLGRVITGKLESKSVSIIYYAGTPARLALYEPYRLMAEGLRSVLSAASCNFTITCVGGGEVGSLPETALSVASTVVVLCPSTSDGEELVNLACRKLARSQTLVVFGSATADACQSSRNAAGTVYCWEPSIDVSVAQLRVTQQYAMAVRAHPGPRLLESTRQSALFDSLRLSIAIAMPHSRKECIVMRTGEVVELDTGQVSRKYVLNRCGFGGLSDKKLKERPIRVTK
jgi:hypothetical protein